MISLSQNEYHSSLKSPFARRHPKNHHGNHLQSRQLLQMLKIPSLHETRRQGKILSDSCSSKELLQAVFDWILKVLKA